MYRIITQQSTTEPVNLPLDGIVDLLAKLGYPGQLLVVDASSQQELARIHPDGGIDYTAQGAQVMRLVRRRD